MNIIKEGTVVQYGPGGIIVCNGIRSPGGGPLSGITAADVAAGTFPGASYTFSSAVSISALTATGQVNINVAGTLMMVDPGATSYGAIRFNQNGLAKGFLGVDYGATIVTGSTNGDMVLRADGGNIRFANSNTLIGTLSPAGALNLAAGLTATTGNFTDTTDASSSVTGALTVAGGLGIAKKLYVGSTLVAPDVQITADGAAGVTSGLCLINQTVTVGASAATLANSPVVGDPTAWLYVNVNGVAKRVPAW